MSMMCCRRSTVRSSACLLLLAGFFALAGGCASAVRNTWFAVADAGERASVSLYTRTLSDPPIELDIIPGPLSVEVTSFGGSIEVVANPKRTTVLVEIVRRGTHGKGRGEDSRFVLDDIRVSAVIGQGELGQALIVRAETTDPEPWFLRADMRIEVPEINGLLVRNGKGAIKLRDAGGRIDVATQQGSILFASIHPLREGVMMITSDGNIDFRVRDNSAGMLDLVAHRGTVSPRIRRGQLIVQQGTTDERFVGVLNGGDQPMVLRTTDGVIRFAVVDSPSAHGRFIR